MLKIISLKNIESIYNLAQKFITGELKLDRKQAKKLLAQFKLDQALDILWEQQQDQPDNVFVYKFNPKEPLFYPVKNSKYPFLINYLTARPEWARPKVLTQKPNQDPHKCGLCVGHRGGKNFADPIARKEWKQTKAHRVHNIRLDNNKKFTIFSNYLPNFDHHFVAAESVGKENKHHIWSMDLHSLVRISEQLNEYCIGQNCILGASSPIHRHFHIFKFDTSLPIEQAKTNTLSTHQIGQHQVKIEKYHYYNNSYKFTINNLKPKIDVAVINFLKIIMDKYEKTEPDNLYTTFARQKNGKLEIIITLIKANFEKAQAIDPNLNTPDVNFRTQLGVTLVHSPEERDKWISNTWSDSKTKKLRKDHISNFFNYYKQDKKTIKTFEASLKKTS